MWNLQLCNKTDDFFALLPWIYEIASKNLEFFFVELLKTNLVETCLSNALQKIRKRKGVMGGGVLVQTSKVS